ncbi:ATP synthase regulation protein NCA2-domain-containing protein [Jimgerdemannia flammicorona]|uniref:ATP synthase regulation protein NCA2-domain-containing protein n=1 Tax=Jimgerdemannia flammicorona TaxID=994334 RepID=A0A433DDF1_9FUNG|nr:ATP synthase regulation protein NCA2-domain-containing protein [Jimgerdemannia flammicorona]
MGFVHDRLTKLNTNISNLISDDQLCSQFYFSDTTLKPSVLAAIKAIDQTTTKSIPDLEKDVLPCLNDLDDELSRGQTETDQFTRLEWLFLARCTAIVYATVLERLLAVTLSLATDIYYWEDIQGSKIWSSYYALQTAPIRIYSLTTATIRSIREHSALPSSSATTAQSALTQFLAPFRSPDHLLHLFPAYMHRSLAKAVPRNYVYFLPSLIRYEIRHKKRRLQNLRRYQAALLGLLMQKGPEFSDWNGGEKIIEEVSRTLRLLTAALEQANSFTMEKDDDVPDVNKLLDTAQHTQPLLTSATATIHLCALITTHLPNYSSRSSQIIQLYGSPSALTRYWPLAVTGYVGATHLIQYLSHNREDLVRWAQEVRQTTEDLVVHWLWEPVLKVWDTIRMKDRDLEAMSKESLRADRDLETMCISVAYTVSYILSVLKSLERMVVDFGREHYHFDDDQIAVLIQQVRDGDVSAVLRAYESEIKHPVWNATMGDLIRTLLIQLQKTKVDVDLTMSALDKLLKSNELNFAFLAVAPTMLLLWGIGWQISTTYQRRSGLQVGKVEQPICDALRRTHPQPRRRPDSLRNVRRASTTRLQRRRPTTVRGARPALVRGPPDDAEWAAIQVRGGPARDRGYPIERETEVGNSEEDVEDV